MLLLKQPVTIIMTYDSYVLQTMLTCIGNKRKLIPHLKEIVLDLKKRINKEQICVFDGFAGSGVVSRMLKTCIGNVISNDMEYYSFLMQKCYLNTPSEIEQKKIKEHIDEMNVIAENGPFVEGFISRLYSPKNTKEPKEGERCFYTRENALIIDSLMTYIFEKVEPSLFCYCMVPLLNKASIHTNTAGVFKGFYKDGKVGKFGGKGENALHRIMGKIKLDMPEWYPNSNCKVYNEDINTLIKTIPEDFDIMYLDPPYNQHPYGSNYFMLILIAKNEEPQSISKVSGIPSNWNKSNYNYTKKATESMKQLLHDGLAKATYVVLSYNNEGIIKDKEWKEIFEPYTIEKKEIVYDTFKGCRNLSSRNNKVNEIIYIISKK